VTGRYTADLRQIDLPGNGWIRATSTFGLYFDFDFSLKPVQVSFGDGFKILHKDLAAAGKISSALGPAYERTIIDGIRWWNGSEMAAAPAMNPR
jgi:hypothetical protein